MADVCMAFVCFLLSVGFLIGAINVGNYIYESIRKLINPKYERWYTITGKLIR